MPSSLSFIIKRDLLVSLPEGGGGGGGGGGGPQKKKKKLGTARATKDGNHWQGQLAHI